MAEDQATGVQVPPIVQLVGLSLLAGLITLQAAQDNWIAAAIAALSTFLGVGGGVVGARRLRRARGK